mmetsp:Transcript_28874/g.69819  ORF Transcript_28874/g.69819 Transcript_28874/m.69819 type:complete len:732 (-) Transcript_28874:173-2368(-)
MKFLFQALQRQQQARTVTTAAAVAFPRRPIQRLRSFATASPTNRTASQRPTKHETFHRRCSSRIVSFSTDTSKGSIERKVENFEGTDSSSDYQSKSKALNDELTKAQHGLFEAECNLKQLKLQLAGAEQRVERQKQLTQHFQQAVQAHAVLAASKVGDNRSASQVEEESVDDVPIESKITIPEKPTVYAHVVNEDSTDEEQEYDSDSDPDSDVDQADEDHEENIVGIVNWLEGGIEHILDPKDELSEQQRHNLIYGRLIDLARLTADIAYDRNHAMVGPMAEASGDDGAAEAWLRGFLALLLHADDSEPRKNLPKWWYENTNSEKDTDHRTLGFSNWENNPHLHALLRLANNRHGDHFVKRCPDQALLKKKWGYADYAYAEMIGQDIIEQIRRHVNTNTGIREEGNPYLPDGGQDDDEHGPGFVTFEKAAMDTALELWGDDMTAELTRLSDEEYAEQQEMKQMEKEGLIKKVGPMEEGDWWGKASHERPEEAYHRLIDGARLGVMMAYEANHFEGAIADAMDNVPPDSSLKDPCDPEDAEGFNWEGTVSDSSDDDDDEQDSDNKSTTATDEENWGGTASGSSDDDDDDDDQQDSNNESTTATDEEEPQPDATYSPTEVGPNAKEHFEKFIDSLRDEKLLPPWWDKDHEAAMWEMALDMKSQHCLAFPMDKDDIKEAYPGDLQRKLFALGESASMAGREEEPDLYGHLEKDHFLSEFRKSNNKDAELENNEV